ncbi:MAG: glycoside hydrolase family 99-like domain-containing protein [Candidatus Microsaccharimonas sp.]
MIETERYILNIDAPTQRRQASRQVELQGWLVLKSKAKKPALRLRQGDIFTDVSYGLPRHDVAVAFSNIDGALTENSGFEQEFECVSEKVSLELNTGDGFKEIHTFNFEIASPYRQFNPQLATTWMDHKNLLETKSFYNFEPLRYTKPGKTKKNKAVAFYLPQYHPIEENDISWGKGFTEWTNVAAASARFSGHHQPFLPGDLGYYDLRLEENIKAQFDMAKNHNIYGFCLYYYWFSGKKVLDLPLNTIIKHPEWDFNYMICWANENWTKRWDGRDKDVIFEQKYREEDPLEFIKDVESVLLDPRYIRVNNKPVLAVYRCEHLDNAKRYATVWREYFKKKHGLELELVSVMSFEGENPEEYGFDAGLDFAPSSILRSNDDDLKVTVSVKDKLIDPYFDGIVFDYRSAVKTIIGGAQLNEGISARIYPCVMPSWDNDARKKGHGSYVFYNESPTLYKKWLQHAFARTTKETPFVFVNAWNEWAEGTVLEPTRHYGYALLNRTREAIDEIEGKKRSEKSRYASIFIDTDAQLKELRAAVKVLLAAQFTVSISVSTQDFSTVGMLKDTYGDTVEVVAVPERGGDILPFVEDVKKVDLTAYDVVVKLGFVANRKTPNNLLKDVRTLERNITKAQKDNTIVFAGKPTASGNNSAILSFIAATSYIQNLVDQNILPEDFSVKSETEFTQGVIDVLPGSFIRSISKGVYQVVPTKHYKTVELEVAE